MLLPVGTIGRSKFRPYMTFTLLVINVLVFILEVLVYFSGPNALEQFLGNYALAVCRISQDPVAVTIRNATLTMFLHGSLVHILFNMIFLWIFAPRVEAFFGHWRFLVFYLIVGWISSAAHAVLGGVSCSPGAMGIVVGASGAIAGVMGAFFWLYPGARVRTLVLIRIVPLPAFLYLLFWVGTDIFRLLTEPASLVAHWAHIGGFIGGIAVLFMVTLFVPAPPGNPLEHLDD